jgi:putative tryptophan/tyrosine transport system substrate-binding protein
MWYSAIGCIVTLILSLTVAPLTAEAQQLTKVFRIGVLHAGSPPSGPAPGSEAFRQGLHDLGYIEGQNLVFESRYAEGHDERLSALAAELVQLKVEVIVAGGPAPTRAAHHACSRTS